jgi:hypothetical protein
MQVYRIVPTCSTPVLTQAKIVSGPDRKTATDQIRRAASLTFASVKLASLLKHETLEPDVFRGTPLDMDQVRQRRSIFNWFMVSFLWCMPNTYTPLCFVVSGSFRLLSTPLWED